MMATATARTETLEGARARTWAGTTRDAREPRDTRHPREGRDEVCREGLCPKYQKAMALLGKRWTGLVLRVLLDGPSRFGDFLARIDGISDPILSERLKELECQGLVQRRVWAETPVRVEYVLTPKGDGLREVLLLLHRWAETWEDSSTNCEEC